MIGKEGVAVKSLVDSQPTKERSWFRQTSFPQDQSAAHYHHHHHHHCYSCDTFAQIFVSTKNLNFVKSFLSFSILCRSSSFFAGRAGSQFCQHITLLNFPLLIFHFWIFHFWFSTFVFSTFDFRSVSDVHIHWARWNILSRSDRVRAVLRFIRNPM